MKKLVEEIINAMIVRTGYKLDVRTWKRSMEDYNQTGKVLNPCSLP
jgi:hypothetical protein